MKICNSKAQFCDSFEKRKLARASGISPDFKFSSNAERGLENARKQMGAARCKRKFAMVLWGRAAGGELQFGKFEFLDLLGIACAKKKVET